MKVIHVFLELDKKEGRFCYFCPDVSTSETNQATYEVYQRSIENNQMISYNLICEECKERYDNKELKICELCGLMEARYYRIKGFCKCILDKKDFGRDIFESDKILETTEAKLSKQIHELSLEKKQLEEDVEVAISALGVAEKWDSRKALIEENQKLKNELEAYKQRRLSDENNKLKEQISILKTELLQLQAQIEILPK